MSGHHKWSEIRGALSPERKAEIKRENDLWEAQVRLWKSLHPGESMPDYGDPFYDTVPEERFFSRDDLEYTVNLTWDAKAGLWVAKNEEIPLVEESGSVDALIEKVRYVVPEILVDNGKPSDVFVTFVTSRREKVYA